MGLCMVLVSDPSSVQSIKALIPEVSIVGEVIPSSTEERINL